MTAPASLPHEPQPQGCRRSATTLELPTCGDSADPFSADDLNTDSDRQVTADRQPRYERQSATQAARPKGLAGEWLIPTAVLGGIGGGTAARYLPVAAGLLIALGLWLLLFWAISAVHDTEDRS